MSKLSFRMSGTDTNEFSNILPTSQIEILLLLNTDSITWYTISSVCLVDRHAKCSASLSGYSKFELRITTQDFMFFPLTALQNLLSTF
jgi:hypothetical protein